MMQYERPTLSFNMKNHYEAMKRIKDKKCDVRSIHNTYTGTHKKHCIWIYALNMLMCVCVNPPPHHARSHLTWTPRPTKEPPMATPARPLPHTRPLPHALRSTPRALSPLVSMLVQPPKTNSLLSADAMLCSCLGEGRWPVAMHVRSNHVLVEGSSTKRPADQGTAGDEEGGAED